MKNWIQKRKSLIPRDQPNTVDGYKIWKLEFWKKKRKKFHSDGSTEFSTDGHETWKMCLKKKFLIVDNSFSTMKYFFSNLNCSCCISALVVFGWSVGINFFFLFFFFFKLQLIFMFFIRRVYSDDPLGLNFFSSYKLFHFECRVDREGFEKIK